MPREAGDKSFPTWLLGDSNPMQWQAVLRTPLDPRHPVRHNIWTSLLDVVQDRVFPVSQSRMDTSSLYIRNVVEDRSVKPSPSSNDWEGAVRREIQALRGLLDRYSPTLVLCFGSFSFEFARRALGREPKRAISYWSSARLGEAFPLRVGQLHAGTTNEIPLLHRVVSGGKFIQAQDYFCEQEGADYFEYVGLALADKLLQYRDELAVWTV